MYTKYIVNVYNRQIAGKNGTPVLLEKHIKLKDSEDYAKEEWMLVVAGLYDYNIYVGSHASSNTRTTYRVQSALEYLPIICTVCWNMARGAGGLELRHKAQIQCL